MASRGQLLLGKQLWTPLLLISVNIPSSVISIIITYNIIMLYEMERNAYFVIYAHYKVTFIVFYLVNLSVKIPTQW